MEAINFLPLDRVQPSQLYVSTSKLARVRQRFDLSRPESIAPVPVVRLCGKTVYTDGHTRAFAAFAAGLAQVPAYWDRDELDWAAYKICVRWCERADIHTVSDLAERVADDTSIQLVFLYIGSLSEPGGPADDYISFMRYNVTAIVEALR